jgi:hypothetical protein
MTVPARTEAALHRPQRHDPQTTGSTDGRLHQLTGHDRAGQSGADAQDSDHGERAVSEAKDLKTSPAAVGWPGRVIYGPPACRGEETEAREPRHDRCAVEGSPRGD